MNDDIEYFKRYLRHADKTALESLERIEKFVISKGTACDHDVFSSETTSQTVYVG